MTEAAAAQLAGAANHMADFDTLRWPRIKPRAAGGEHGERAMNNLHGFSTT